MVYGIGKVVWFVWLIMGGVVWWDMFKFVLILCVENGDQLCVSIGLVFLDRMMDVLVMWLGMELWLLLCGWMLGQMVLCGLFVVWIEVLLGFLVQFGVICCSSIDLGDLCMMLVINVVIVSDMVGVVDVVVFWVYGYCVICVCSFLVEIGQICFVEYFGVDSQQVSQVELLFFLEQICICFQLQFCCDMGWIFGLCVVGWVDYLELGVLDLYDLWMWLDEQMLVEVFCIILCLLLVVLCGWDWLGCDLLFVSLLMSDCELVDLILVEVVLWELDWLDLVFVWFEIEVIEFIGCSGGCMLVIVSL